MLKRLILPALIAASVPLAAQPVDLRQQVDAEIARAPAGTRFGLLVVDADGREVIAINPDARFVPASNTKLFTTAAAMALLAGTDQPDSVSGAEIDLRIGKRKNAPDVLLRGRGDARLSSAADCKIDCLATLADTIAARTRSVGSITGDDTLFPDQRWSPGMSWNNFGSNDATAASALTLDSNELTVSVVPGAVGQPPQVAVPPYVTLTNEARTTASGKTELVFEHVLNSRAFRLYGTIPVGAGEWRERIGIDDPAHYAAWSLARMLEARGVKVRGGIEVLHRPMRTMDLPGWRAADHPGAIPDAEVITIMPVPPLAKLAPDPLAGDVTIINKDSQNLHAEVLIRRIGLLGGSGSLEQGLANAAALFEKAGIPRSGFDFSDGSGMSTYNRVSPRAGVALLRWAATQPWGASWRASLPIGGIDGTLKRRFSGSILEGRVWAKTGTLDATNALSGYLRAASGRELVFSAFANDVPGGGSVATVLDAILLRVAAAN